MMQGQSLLCVITGASRGYGRTLALVLAEVAGPSSVFLLLARSSSGLSETRDLMLKVNGDLRVETCTVDLASADSPELDRCLSRAAASSEEQFSVGLLIHNAGSVGNPSQRAKEHSSRAEVLAYCGLNVASPILLTGAYLSALRGRASRHVIVNISSLAAVEPLSSLSMYCTGKAGRDMYFRCLALEEGSCGDVRVLNWAPGSMETAMVAEVREKTFDAKIRERLDKEGLRKDGVDSARKLVAVLELNIFGSGKHLDCADA